MASRLALVERELLAAKREVIEKDNYISQLEERIVALDLEKSLRKQNTQPAGEQDQRREELEIKCRALQKQVDDMEVRLNTWHNLQIILYHSIILCSMMTLADIT